MATRSEGISRDFERLSAGDRNYLRGIRFTREQALVSMDSARNSLDLTVTDSVYLNRIPLDLEGRPMVPIKRHYREVKHVRHTESLPQLPQPSIPAESIISAQEPEVSTDGWDLRSLLMKIRGWGQ